jgi:hypothetical protein
MLWRGAGQVEPTVETTPSVGTARRRLAGWWAGPGKVRDAVRCSICRQRVGADCVRLQESADLPEPRRSWILCVPCHHAVQDTLDRSPVRTPMRMRIAVGVVASERAPRDRLHFWEDGYWDRMGDHALDRALIWVFGVAFVVHALAFAAIAAYIAIAH